MRTLFVAVMLVGLAAPLTAARIDGLTAVAKENRLGVSFALQSAAGEPDFRSALRSGLPTGFTYEIELVRKRPNWFDSHVASMTIEVIATFNSRTDEYLLNYRRDRRLVRSETFTSVDALLEAMTRIEERDILPLGGTNPNKLRVGVRAIFSRHVVFWVIPRSRATDWAWTRVESR